MIPAGLYTPTQIPAGNFRRIVSLVPSLTETLVGLGLADLLVGRTRFCTSSPEILGPIPRIGGTKDPDLKRVADLQPDLVLAVKEENRSEDVLALAEHFPVLVFDIQTVQDALECTHILADLLGASPELCTSFLQEAEPLLLDVPTGPHPRCLYLIWKEPYMTVGADTYIAAMMEACGLSLPDASLTRYPLVDLPRVLMENRVDAILLSSEPYPFREKHAEGMQQTYGVPTFCVDGQMFSWYGTLTPAGLRYGRALREKLLKA